MKEVIMKRIILTLFLSCLLPGLLLAQPKNGVRGNMLISSDWLAKNGNNPKVVVIYVGRDNKDYRAGHIPNLRG